MTGAFLESAALGRLVTYLEPGSPYRGVLLALMTLVILICLHRLTRRRLQRYVEKRAHKDENPRAFLRLYDAVWKVLIAIVVIVAAVGSFPLLGLTVGVIGVMLGWSLQAPIRGLAAWVMLVLKKPFRVGDRITVANVTGDVTDIQLNHIVLNQVGGTVQGEERSGRGILVPNAMLFSEEIINYNLFSEEEAKPSAPTSRFMLDEVVVRVTFGSNFEFAKKLCLEAAKHAVADLIGETDQEPFTRAEFMPWGLLIRVRYKTVPAKRQEVSSRVTELIWRAFNENRKEVRFCIPVSAAGVVPTPGHPPPPMARGGSAP